MATVTSMPSRAANGWHEMRTAEGRTCLTEGGVVPGAAKGASTNESLNGDGSVRRTHWSEVLGAWVVTQFTREGAVAAHVIHRGSMATAQQALLDALA